MEFYKRRESVSEHGETEITGSVLLIIFLNRQSTNENETSNES